MKAVAHPWRRPPDELRDQLAPTTPRQIYRRAVIADFEPEQASTLAAWRVGIHIDETRGPWPLRAVEHLLFLRVLADQGRLGGPDDGDRR